MVSGDWQVTQDLLVLLIDSF